MARTMTRYNPMTEMMTLHDAMDRFLVDSFVRPFSDLAQTIESSMPIDMYQENNQLVVKTSMPGVRPEDVDIQVQDNILTISGEVKSEQGPQGDGGQQQPAKGQSPQQGQAQNQKQQQGQGQNQMQRQGDGQSQMQRQGDGQTQMQQQGNDNNYYLREREYVRYVRSVTLPVRVQADKAEATLENGVLTLRLPIAEEARQNKIQVKAK